MTEQDRHQRLFDLFERARSSAGSGYAAVLREADAENLGDDLRALLEHEGTRGDALDTPGVVASLLEGSAGDHSFGGRFRLIRRLGSGGSGTVWLARQSAPLERDVALKVLHALAVTAEARARFDLEREALARMRHPNVARVLEAGVTEEGRPYLAMEVVDGPTLTEWCRQRRLSARERAELLLAVCEGVAHAHTRGVIHRDLKPGNVLVAEEGGKPTPKVIDFSVARRTGSGEAGGRRRSVTRTGEIIGTLGYLAPEQLGDGRGIDVRTDVWGLGCLLYEALCGRGPVDPQVLERGDPVEIARAVQEVDPPRPSRVARGAGAGEADVREMERELDWIALTALAKEPERRYPSAAEMAADLRRYLGNEPILARPPSRRYRFGRFARRRRLELAAGSVAGLGLLLGIGLMGVGLVRAEGSRRIAERRAEEVALVNGFLNDELLGSVSPEADGRDVPVRAILDRASETVAGAFPGRPRLEGQLRRTLGRTYMGLGELSSAEEHLRRAAELFDEAGRAEDRVDAARARGEQGLVLATLGRAEEAEILLREARPLLIAELSADHPDALAATQALADTLDALSRHEEAEALYREALAGRRKTLGEGATRTLESLNGLALALDNQGRAAEAIALLTEGLRAAEAGGDRGLGWISCLANLAAMHQDANEHERALPLLERAAAAAERVWGPEHFNTMVILGNLASAERHAGRLAEAEAALRRVLESQRAVLGPEHRNTLTTETKLAGVLAEVGRADEAEAMFRAALATGDRTLPEGDWLRGALRHLLGACLVDRGRAAEAVPVLEEGHAMLAATLGADHVRTRGCAVTLWRACDALGDAEGVAVWRAKGGELEQGIGAGEEP